MNTRAQSSVIGPVLLVGVFVTVGVVAGGAVVTNVVDQSTGIEANVAGEIDNGELRLTHMGGNSIQADDLQLLIRGDVTTDFPFTSGTLNGGPIDSQDRFTAGDVWRADLSSRPEFINTESWSSISVRFVTDSGDVVATISTVEEIISTEVPETYVPGGTPTSTPTPTPTPTPTQTPTPTPDDENGNKPPADSVYTITDDGDMTKVFDVIEGNNPQWDFGDGTTSNNYYRKHQYQSAGQYTITLDITIDGTEYQYTETIDTAPVTNDPNKPSADSVYTITDDGDRTKIFDVIQGNDPQWDFGDGTTSNNYYRNHRYSSDGEYTVTLDVTIDGTRYRYTETVNINSGPGNGNNGNGNGNNGNGNGNNGNGN